MTVCLRVADEWHEKPPEGAVSRVCFQDRGHAGECPYTWVNAEVRDVIERMAAEIADLQTRLARAKDPTWARGLV